MKDVSPVSSLSDDISTTIYSNTKGVGASKIKPDCVDQRLIK